MLDRATEHNSNATAAVPPSLLTHKGAAPTLEELAALEDEAKAKVKAYRDLLALHKCQELGGAGVGNETRAEEHCAILRTNADLASVAYGEATSKRLDAAAAAGALTTPGVGATSAPRDPAGAGDAGTGATPFIVAAVAVAVVLLLAAGGYAAKKKAQQREDHEFDGDGGGDGELPPLPPLPPAGPSAGPSNGHGVAETRLSADDGVVDQVLDQVLRAASESASLGDANGQEPTYEVIQTTNSNAANAYGLLTGVQAQYEDVGQAYEVMDLRSRSVASGARPQPDRIGRTPARAFGLPSVPTAGLELCSTARAELTAPRCHCNAVWQVRHVQRLGTWRALHFHERTHSDPCRPSCAAGPRSNYARTAVAHSGLCQGRHRLGSR